MRGGRAAAKPMPEQWKPGAAGKSGQSQCRNSGKPGRCGKEGKASAGTAGNRGGKAIGNALRGTGREAGEFGKRLDSGQKKKERQEKPGRGAHKMQKKRSREKAPLCFGFGWVCSPLGRHKTCFAVFARGAHDGVSCCTRGAFHCDFFRVVLLFVCSFF